MKDQTEATTSVLKPELNDGSQLGESGKAEVDPLPAGLDPHKDDEAKRMEAVEALEHQHHPTELSDEELMNLDFAGC